MSSEAELQPTDRIEPKATKPSAHGARGSAWLRGLFVAVGLLALQALAILATDPADRFDFNWFRALALPLLAGYGAAAIPLILASGTHALRRLAPTLPGGAREAEREAAKLDSGARRRWAVAGAIGVAVPLIIGTLLRERAARVLAGVPIDLYFVIAAMTFWSVATHVIQLVIDVGRRLRRVAHERVRVDLFHLEALRPFGAFGLQQALVILGGITVAFALLATPDADQAWLMRLRLIAGVPLLVPLLAGTFLVAGAAFLAPMWAIRRRIQEEKAAVLERVSAQLGPHWEETADLERTAQTLGLPGLLALRAQIGQLAEWPVDDGMKRRFGLYLLLPVFSLLLKGLVEAIIEQLVV